MTRVYIDFETKSFADLKRVGTWAYSEHPTTEVICLCYAIDNGEVRDWVSGPIPDDLSWAIRGGCEIEAHNVAFELSIWANICVKKWQWPSIFLRQWRDSMAAACYYAMPAALDALCRALGWEGKDPEGSRLITKYSKLHLKTAKQEIPPEDLAKFVAYCRRDVELERAVSNYLGDLPERELPYFHLDLEINQRGLTLDQNGIEVASRIVDQRSEELVERFRELTGLNPTQGAKLLVWFAEQGVKLDNMQADHLEELLEEGLIPAGPAREALHLRLKVNKASTKKLDAMTRNVASDGTAKFQSRYHGAATGRDTGSGFQPLNLVRSWEDVDPDQLVRDVMYGDAGWLDALYGDAMEAISKAGRHWIVARPGNRILAGDFVSIEAVVLACMAGEEWKVQAFRDKVKIYELMGDKIHGLPSGTVTKKTHPDMRQDGKTCLGASVQILTHRGWVPIVEVTRYDKVWDGIEWVTHSGVACQGHKRTINLLGAEITSDHQVLSNGTWHSAAAVSSNAKLRSQALANGSARLPWWATSWADKAAFWRSGCGATAASGNTWSARVTFATGGPLAVQHAPVSQQESGANSSGASLIFAPMMHIGAGYSIGLPRVSRVVNPARIRTMAPEGSSCMSRGPAEQKASAGFSRISCRFRDGMSRLWRSTVRTMIAAICRAISSSRRAAKTTSIGGPSPPCKPASLGLKPVYDIANAGPRKRFTILTDAGPLIVHNCELAFGYQGALGAWLKFDSSGRHTDERIVEICKAWRAEHPMTVAMWRGLEDAAIGAMRGSATQYRSVGFERIDEWLSMILPNGKRLWYREPELKVGMPRWHTPETKKECADGTCSCQPREYLSYKAQKEGQWKRVATYGGKLTENAVQGASREYLMPSVVAANKAGYPVVLKVYDEVVADVPIGHGSKAEFEAILRDAPGREWAKGWPIDVDAWEGQRYRK